MTIAPSIKLIKVTKCVPKAIDPLNKQIRLILISATRMSKTRPFVRAKKSNLFRGENEGVSVLTDNLDKCIICLIA